MKPSRWIVGLLAAPLFFVLVFALTGCNKATPGSGEGPDKVLATVNGTPITAIELDFHNRGGHGAKPGKQQANRVLSNLIEEELLYQRGMELGLDKSPDFQRNQRMMELRAAAAKRKELARRVINQEMTKAQQVSDEELKALYEKKKSRIQISLVLAGLQFRDEQHAQEALKQIQGGTAFEAIAKGMFPANHQKQKNGTPPWVIGTMEWERIPPQWEDILYNLEPGQISDVVKDKQGGRNTGVRLFKLMEKKARPDSSFQAVRSALSNRLRSVRVLDAREKLIQQLKKEAEIKQIPIPNE